MSHCPNLATILCSVDPYNAHLIDVVSSYPAWLARPSLPTQTRVGDEDGDDDSHEAWKCAIHMQGADVSLQEFAFLGIVP